MNVPAEAFALTPCAPDALRLDYFQDPGHGWLAVPVSLLRSLGIAAQVSRYSYISRDGLTAYLEEDCDAHRFMDAMQGRPIAIECTPRHSNGESFVRRLPSYPQQSALPLSES